MMPRKKTEPRPKIDRSDWRNLPTDQWNVRTFTQMFADLNRENYGVDTYLPFRNWSAESGMIKRSLQEHGAELLRQAFDECFRTYVPTRDYPILTAGFCVAYRINTIIPRLKAEKEREESAKLAEETADYSALESWL